MARTSTSTGIETKVAASSTTTIAAGYISWLLITFVPGLNDTIPADLQGQLPVVIAFLLSTVAAYFAPHTIRPDLQPVEPPAQQDEPGVPPARP